MTMLRQKQDENARERERQEESENKKKRKAEKNTRNALRQAKKMGEALTWWKDTLNEDRTIADQTKGYRTTKDETNEL